MPNKTIYLSDADMPTADRAAEIAGGLSPAIARALREFVVRHDLRQEGFVDVHVDDHSGGRSSTKIFSGRQLAVLRESAKGSRTVWRSYATPKDNIAIVRTTEPDSVEFIFDGAFRGDMGNRVNEAVNGVLGGALGGSLANTLGNIGAKLGEQMRNHDRSTERFMGGWGGDVVEHEAGESTGAHAKQESPSAKLEDPEEPADGGATATLEVFEDTEALKAAAFREPTAAKPEIPASFIAATEKALGTPPVEYLDI